MYRDLGVHWAAALPGFIALACIPFVWVFYKHGAKIRAKCRYAADAERQMALIMAAHKKRMEADTDVEQSAASEPSPDEEWTTYQALADRDEVDLNDEERIRLQALHEKYRRPSASSQATVGEPAAVKTEPQNQP
jgi:hypothetical protein